MKAQNGKCVYCFTPMVLQLSGISRLSDNTATLDHIIPRSKGGKYDMSHNTVCACHKCNNQRGDMCITKFLIQQRNVHESLCNIL